MKSELERQLAELKLGEHLCLIYQDAAEQMAAIVPFIKAGLTRGECCLYIADHSAIGQVAAALAGAGVNVQRERERNALILLTERDTYQRGARFEPDAMIDLLRLAVERALAAGFIGLRATGEMTWVLGPEISCARLIEYEAKLNTFLPETRALAICQYDRRGFAPLIIRDVLRTHPLAVLGSQVCPNLYYESRELMLGQRSGADLLDYMIANIERMRTVERVLQESEARFRSAFGDAATGMALVATDGRFLQVNRSLCEMVGYSEQELQATKFQAITHPDDLAPYLNYVRRTLAGELRSFQMEQHYIHKRGHVVWGLLSASLVRDAGGNPLYFVSQIQDITSGKRLEGTLQPLYLASLQIQESLGLQERLERLLRVARTELELDRVNILLPDVEGRMLKAVASFGSEEPLETISVPIGPEGGGLAQAFLTQQMVSWDGRGRVPDPLRLRPPYDQIEAFRSQVFANVPLVVQGQAIGVLGADRKQSRRPLDSATLNLLQLFASQVAVAIHNSRLLDQVLAGRQRLQALSRLLVDVQEAERRHIARELHDQIGQTLTGLRLSLEMTGRSGSISDVRPRLEGAQALVNDLLSRVRDLSLELRPAMLDDLGLLPALLWHFERYTAQTQVRVNFMQGGLEGRPPPEVETATYRIVQEALTNVARHAGVTEVAVRLWADSQTLQLQIDDQGAGFDPVEALAGPTSGLAGMRERAFLLGGALTVESAPGAGTRVTATLPLEEPIERRTQERGG